MKTLSFFASLLLLIPSFYAKSIFAASRSQVYPYQVWEALTDNPRDIRKVKKLFDAISKDSEKLKELAEIEEPLTTFMTKLASRKVTRETADIFEKLLVAAKNGSVKNLSQQIRMAISELDPMCNVNRPKDESTAWQRVIIALIRQVDEFDICEWSEASFIDAVLRFGKASDLKKVLKSIAPEWYTGEIVSRLGEHWQRNLKDEHTGATRKFIDIVMDFEAERQKKLKEVPNLSDKIDISISDEIQKRIKKPILDDDPETLKEILKTINEKN